LKFVNKYCETYIGATSSINDECTHLTSDSASGVENLLPLAWLTSNLLDMECSTNHQEFTYIQSDQSLIRILYFLFTCSFFNSLNFFHLFNAENSSIRTIYLEVSITMTFKTLFTLKSLWWYTSNPFTLVKSVEGYRGSDSFVRGRITLRYSKDK